MQLRSVCCLAGLTGGDYPHPSCPPPPSPKADFCSGEERQTSPTNFKNLYIFYLFVYEVGFWIERQKMIMNMLLLFPSKCCLFIILISFNKTLNSVKIHTTHCISFNADGVLQCNPPGSWAGRGTSQGQGYGNTTTSHCWHTVCILLNEI